MWHPERTPDKNSQEILQQFFKEKNSGKVNAIILAVGEGKRLNPLTNNIPKCIVKLFGKTLLQRQTDIMHLWNFRYYSSYWI